MNRPGDEDGPPLGSAVLDSLRDGKTQVTVGDLASTIADTEEYEDVHERLFEEVLPDLDKAGKLSFDRERGTVATTRRRQWERVRSLAGPQTVLPLALLLSLPALPHAHFEATPFVGAGLAAVVSVCLLVALLE